MKVSFNRESLQEILTLVTSVIPTRTPKPILQCLRITAEEQQVQISATDLEVGVNCSVTHVQVEDPGQAVVPADRLFAIVRETADDVISLQITDTACHITGTDSYFTIYGHDPAQYPRVPDYDGETHLEIALDALKEAISKTLFAVARESTRYAINGILWEIKGKKLVLIATDGRRLARCRTNLVSPPPKTFPSTRAIAPAKTMVLLEKIPAGPKDILTVRFAGNQILMQCSGIVISSNLVEGNFPKYEDIIPTDYDKKLVLNTEATLSAVRRAALLTNKESKGIRISISKNSAVFSSRAPETGDAKIDMAVNYKGEPVDVGFNPQFLIDALRVLKSEDFELELGQPDKPGLIKSGPNFLYVVMPINLG